MEKDLSVFEEIINEAKGCESTTQKCLPLLFDTKEMRYTKLVPLTILEKHYPNIYEPTVIIRDRKKFNTTFLEYLKIATDFYENDLSLSSNRNPLKYLIYNTLYKALPSDFDDIRNLFQREINYIKNVRLNDYLNPKNIGYSNLLCGNLIIGLAKEDADSVSPLSIHISLERVINNKLYYYDFPCVRYGISGSTAYIYEIEKVCERSINADYFKSKEYLSELENYQLSVKKLINKAIKTNEIVAEEAIALTCAITLLEERGIKDILVPTVFINRYNSLEISAHQTMAKLNNVLEEASVKGANEIAKNALGKMSILKHTLNSHEQLVEEKNTHLIKNFKYLEDIFSNYKIYDLPMQKDTYMHFNIIPNGNVCQNKLLKDLHTLIHDYEEKMREIKDEIHEKN